MHQVLRSAIKLGTTYQPLVATSLLGIGSKELDSATSSVLAKRSNFSVTEKEILCEIRNLYVWALRYGAIEFLIRSPLFLMAWASAGFKHIELGAGSGPPLCPMGPVSVLISPGLGSSRWRGDGRQNRPFCRSFVGRPCIPSLNLHLAGRGLS